MAPGIPREPWLENTALVSQTKGFSHSDISSFLEQSDTKINISFQSQTSVMEGAMSQTTATNIPTDAVDILMKQAADESGIELSHELPSAASNTIGTAQQVATSEPDELSQRLARLRQV